MVARQLHCSLDPTNSLVQCQMRWVERTLVNTDTWVGFCCLNIGLYQYFRCCGPTRKHRQPLKTMMWLGLNLVLPGFGRPVNATVTQMGEKRDLAVFSPYGKG